MNRYLHHAILNDALADKKMAFISGPRQVGKTTLAKMFLQMEQNYYNWDEQTFRKSWVNSPELSLANRGYGPVVLDEIHKDRQWKSRLKGIYDRFGQSLPILVTGSARLDIFRKGSDSLMGRYFPYRLFPFTVAESELPLGPEKLFQKQNVRFPWRDLLRLSGFPEPLIGGQEKKALRWSRLRLDRIVFEDSRDLRNISDMQRFRNLLELLPVKVCSLFSYNSLREDIEVAYATIRDWVTIAEALYFGFFIRPFSKSVRRALTAEPKFYLFDILQIPAENMAQRRENLAALHLLKACQFWTDTAQGSFELKYLRDREKRETDFFIIKDKKPWLMIECKTNEIQPDANLIYFNNLVKPQRCFQLVDLDDTSYERHYPAFNITVISYERFFSSWL